MKVRIPSEIERPYSLSTFMDKHAILSNHKHQDFLNLTITDLSTFDHTIAIDKTAGILGHSPYLTQIDGDSYYFKFINKEIRDVLSQTKKRVIFPPQKFIDTNKAIKKRHVDEPASRYEYGDFHTHDCIYYHGDFICYESRSKLKNMHQHYN